MKYWKYSVVSNKQAGSNKRAGWIFQPIPISEQALISEQVGGKFCLSNKLGYINTSILCKEPFANYVMPLRWVGGQQNITIANFIK